MQFFGTCSKSAAIAFVCSVLLCTSVCESAADAMCNNQPETQFIDFFNIFTQQVQRVEQKSQRLQLPVEAPRMPGMDPNEPAFQFTGQGLQYNNSQAVGSLRNASCNTKQITIYASMFFMKRDIGGPLVVLSQDDSSSNKAPLLGLFVEPASNQYILMYRHRNIARVEKFQHEIPRGKWTKVGITLSGSVVVLHVDCIEVMRRVIPVPDYCVDSSKNIVASIGETLNSNEFGMGLTGSLQNVGISFGMNGLSKQCPQVTETEICPTCGQFLVTLNKVYQLTEQVKQLEAQIHQVASDAPTPPSSSTSCEETINDSPNCLINDMTRPDNSFTINREGKVCFCDNGHAHCAVVNEIATIPPSTATESTPLPRSRAQSEQPTTATRTCRVHGGTKVLPEGDRFFVKDDNVCREFFCKDFYGDLSPQEVSPPHSCLTRYPCSHNLTELQRNISICCDQCSACDFSTCPGNSTCQDQGGSTFTCNCDAGFERSMNGTCVDRDECKLGHQEGGHNCPSHSTCINTIGSFECMCNSGFRKNGMLCEDINECTENRHNCPDHSECYNRVPGYICNCTSGYTRQGDKCVPVCESGCSNGGLCTAPGVCTCLSGFTGPSCGEDINECNHRSRHDCTHIRGRCINTFGGHFCRCDNGYQHSGRTCADVNECALGLDNCVPEAKCENIFGSFNCICPGEWPCNGYCHKDNQTLVNHESRLFGQDKCDNCTCTDGELSCKPLECDCSNPDVSTSCCPQCREKNVCVMGNSVVTVGTELPDPTNACIKRRCIKNGTFMVVNQHQSCPSLSCDSSEQYVPEGACCPVCQLPNCTAQNNGTTVRLASTCKSCTCKSNEWECASTVQCSQDVSCPDSEIVYVSGQCCPVCKQTLLSKMPCNSS